MVEQRGDVQAVLVVNETGDRTTGTTAARVAGTRWHRAAAGARATGAAGPDPDAVRP